MLRLLLGIEYLLERQDLVDKKSVRLRNVGEELLELLDLLLRSRELLGDDAYVLAGGEVLGDLWFPRRGRLSSDVVEVILAIDSEIGVLEF